ncbi:MAG: ATP-grasp domain-containing protein [Lachnospiraceae bacterium]|nr:ATP-grasp domain-containing protein [Lachnospiraceae bacterium]
MKPKKVLIFPAGTEIAFEIHNALKYSKFVELYGANSMPSHAEFVFERCYEGLPFEKEPGFIDALNALIDKWHIDYIYPARDSACLILTCEAANLHTEVVTSPLRTVEICRSKNRTYEFFEGEDFIPRNYHSIEEIQEYPVFAKPSVGQGSVGARRINSAEELMGLLSLEEEYVICEYLPGEEFTVDCFTDRHGKLRVCHPRNRERIKTGISVRSSLILLDDEIKRIAERINEKLVFNGAWFFQVKKDANGRYVLMEASPRIPGTMGVSRNLGINYPLLTLYNMWGYDVDIIDNETNITLDRAFISRYKTSVKYQKVYIDFDDTLYIRDKVNVMMVAFLYQCVNKGIPIILLTKHSNNIHDSLKKYKISEELFSEIIHIEQQEDKSKYIEADGILIDDSFAERKNVRDKVGIPVYDLDMIESLIDWRI